MRKILLGALILGSVGCRHSETQAPPPTAQAASAQPEASGGARFAQDPRPTAPGISLDAMDLTRDPCDDFYKFACGGWLKHTEIPADRSVWSRSFSVIGEHNENTLHTILDDIVKGSPPAGNYAADKLGAFYGSCLDETQEDAALKQLKGELKKLNVASPKAVVATLAHLQNEGVRAGFDFSADQDYEHADRTIAELDQAGLGLPDRDYYLADSGKKKEVLEDYRHHAARVFELLGESPDAAKADAASVIDFETALAKASLDKVARRNPKNLHHKMDLAGLKAATPGFDWAAYFKGISAPKLDVVNVTHVPFFAEVAELVKTAKPATWRAYLTLRTVDDDTLALPKAFGDEQFEFTSKALTGVKQDPVRWKKCVRATDRLMGEADGVPFVKETFGAEGKAKSEELMRQIEGAFERDLDTLDWMDAATKQRAVEKERAILNKIGYPDPWRNYDALKVDRASFLHSLQGARHFELARQLAKMGKPTDRKEWLMTPAMVNAYYNPPTNEITIPAGILQPPFFDRGATMPVNFGGVGLVMGHELTHGFDDQGRQYDAKGNFTDWWSPASGETFVKKADCVKRQFDNYVAIDDVHVNGGLTLGENAADLGGLRLAHAAMEKYLSEHPDEAHGNYRFTPSQQFFLGFAQAWCEKERPESARMHALTNPHSPGFLRVDGPLRNLENFKRAFQCKDGSGMTRPTAEVCRIW